MKTKVKNFFSKLIKLPFLHKKPLYIVLVIVLSLFLLADVALAVFMPDTSGMQTMQGMQMDAMGDVSFGDLDDAAAVDGEDAQEGDTATDGMGSVPDMSEMGEMPDATDMADGTELPSADDTDDATAFGDADITADGNAKTAKSFSVFSLLQTVRTHWLLILVILSVLDAGSIYMLVRVVRREKKQKRAEAKALREAMAEGEVHIVRPVKKTKKHSHYMWIIALVVIVALVLIVKVLTRQTASSGTETEATTYTETAALGDISTVLPGAGTLVEEDAETVSLPDAVEITTWYVSNGDTVEEGDVLAAVDTVSVMTAIASVQESLSSLDEALAECEDDAVSSTITAASAGRVIKVYASADTSVVDTMYENGALMLLSLDGYLAVTFETDAEISSGESVSVTLSDGTVISGKVESMTNKTAVIVVAADEAELEDTVSVETEDGASVGTGTLYIHSELKVTGFTGTVSSVSVSEGSKVSSGATLLTLTDTEYTGAYEVLLEQRTELESQMETLFGLYQDGYLYASCSGVISGLSSSVTSSSSDADETADSTADTADTVSADTSESATGTSSSNTGYTISTLSYSATSSVSATRLVVSDDNSATKTTYDSASTGETGVTLKIQEEEEEPATEGSTFALAVVGSVTDDKATVQYVSGNGDEEISLEKLSGIYKDGSYSTMVSVQDVSAGDVLIILYDSDKNVSAIICMVTTVNADDAISQEPASDETDTAGDAVGTDESSTAGIGGNVTDATEEMSEATESAGGEMTASQDAVSGSAEATDALTEAVSSTYSVSETTLLSITPQDTMTVTITVDELDILSLETGLEATVTLDAFPGQSFTGEVTAINQSGTNSGGSSKYTAEITISREEGMLAGMNASAVITLSTTENVLCIPETALLEQDGAVYVYTTYDEKSDTLGGLLEVTCGISDGENVEITSGLEEGDTYYYSVLDVVNYSSSYATSSGGGGFSLQSLMGGGMR